MPEAAPGEAANPFVNSSNFFLSSGLKIGNRNCSRCSGSTLKTASSFVINVSFTISHAIFAAAIPDLLPDLVCNKNNVSFSIVNSKSCMSLKCLSKILAVFSICE